MPKDSLSGPSSMTKAALQKELRRKSQYFIGLYVVLALTKYNFDISRMIDRWLISAPIIEVVNWLMFITVLRWLPALAVTPYGASCRLRLVNAQTDFFAACIILTDHLMLFRSLMRDYTNILLDWRVIAYGLHKWQVHTYRFASKYISVLKQQFFFHTSVKFVMPSVWFECSMKFSDEEAFDCLIMPLLQSTSTTVWTLPISSNVIDFFLNLDCLLVAFIRLNSFGYKTLAFSWEKYVGLYIYEIVCLFAG